MDIYIDDVRNEGDNSIEESMKSEIEWLQMLTDSVFDIHYEIR